MTPNEESGYALLAAFEDRMARRDNAAEWRMRMWRGEEVPGEVQPDLFNNDKEGV